MDSWQTSTEGKLLARSLSEDAKARTRRRVWCLLDPCGVATLGVMWDMRGGPEAVCYVKGGNQTANYSRLYFYPDGLRKYIEDIEGSEGVDN